MDDKPKTAASQPQAAPREAGTEADRQRRLAAHRRLFIRMGLDMSWQLALVVIVPIVGGYMLDQHYHRSPLLTLCGLAVAVIGVFGVLTHVVSESNKQVADEEQGHE